MAFNTYNNNNNNNHLNLYNQRAATLISSSNGQSLVPLHALSKYFPSFFNNGMPQPHVGNASNTGQNNNSQSYGGYQPPNDLSYNGSGGNVNPMHITNNTSWGSAQNWFNGQSQNYAGHQLQPGSGFGSLQQLGYPSDYISTNIVPSSTNFQQVGSYISLMLVRLANPKFKFSAPDAIPPISFTDPYQYPVQTQSTASFHQNLNGTQSLFGYNGPPLETNNESNSALWPLYNDAACFHDYSNTPHRVVGTDEAVAIGPNMQTMHSETNSNMASALSAGAPFPSFSNTSYPTTIFPEFLSLQNPSKQAFPSEFSTGLTNTFYHPNDLLSQSSTSSSSSFTTTSASDTTETTTFEEDPDNIPGLYQKKIGNSGAAWKCTFRECTKTTYHRRDRTRHIGKHANWEDRQIKAGLLRPEDAIAIPWRQLMIYKCDIPNCGYFLETGNKFVVENYRIDRRKGLHIKKYHSCDNKKNVCGKDGEEKVKKRRKNGGGRIAKSKNRRET